MHVVNMPVFVSTYIVCAAGVQMYINMKQSKISTCTLVYKCMFVSVAVHEVNISTILHECIQYNKRIK